LEELVAGLLRPRLFPFGKLSKAKSAAQPSFLNDLIKTMTGPPPPPTQHNGGGGGGEHTAQLSTSSINTTRGAAAGPLHTGPPGRCAATTVPDLRRTVPSAGAVNTFLSPRDRRKNRQGVHASPQGGPDTSRYGASQAAAQGSPRCAGATCPHAAADTAGRPRQVTFNLPQTAPPTTSSSSAASGRRFATSGRRTDSTSEPATAEFGGDLSWRTVCSYYVFRLDRHVTYYTSHMLYICIYSP
jgi:hypothetical protein